MVFSSFGEFRIGIKDEEDFNKLCNKSLELNVNSIPLMGKRVEKYQRIKISSLNQNILLIAQRNFSHEIFLLKDESQYRKHLKVFIQRISISESPQINLLVIGGSGDFNSKDRRFMTVSYLIRKYASKFLSLIALKDFGKPNMSHSLVIHEQSLSVCKNTKDLFSDAYEVLHRHIPRVNFVSDPLIVQLREGDNFPEEFEKASILGKNRYFISYLENEEMDDGMMVSLSSIGQIVLVSRGYDANNHLTHIGMCDLTDDNFKAVEFIEEMAKTSKIDLSIWSMERPFTDDQAVKEVILAITSYRSKITIKNELIVFDNQFVGINKHGHIFYGSVSNEQEDMLLEPHNELETSISES